MVKAVSLYLKDMWVRLLPPVPKWAISAIGQSCRLITDWFSVRVRGGPPKSRYLNMG